MWFQALEVDKSINAVCDFILEASDWAEALENIPENERGPLYGIPISVKVSFISSFFLHHGCKEAQIAIIPKPCLITPIYEFLCIYFIKIVLMFRSAFIYLVMKAQLVWHS